MSVVFQDALHPGTVLASLTEIASPDTRELSLAVAYVSMGGYALLFPRLKNAIGASDWDNLPKTVITSFDFGHSEPNALEHLAGVPNCAVRISTRNVLASGHVTLSPGASNFHPKIYAFQKAQHVDALIGSPNLSNRALTVNTEMAVIQRDLRAAVFGEFWSALGDGSVALTPELLQAYIEIRPHVKPPDAEDEPLTPEPVPPPGTLPVLGDEVASGNLNPASFQGFWVEAGSMSSGGSHNQLELPRAANRFFGYDFNAYDDDHHTIGTPTLRSRGQDWTKPLTWHGNNRMERINLPTEYQGGYLYPNTAVLFRRSADGFEFEVAPWDSQLAIAWRNASQAAGTTYRVGRGGGRLCGLIQP